MKSAGRGVVTERRQGQALLVRVDEAASMLGVGMTTIYRLIRSRDLRAVKIGTATRIATDELRAFVARRTCGAA